MRVTRGELFADDGHFLTFHATAIDIAIVQPCYAAVKQKVRSLLEDLLKNLDGPNAGERQATR